ncbi:hypothetical protein LJ739_07955 [Aestuariibacter halophilus]|uniref:HNH endonuclease n=1 Tax=Fluctibacter halophilus TaxID=226011 RepID=A0ABS8G8M3_9ALTE|nr:hypothetical protein [Aestuariibacter halophilus]MCC2616170.1 hypothetical protein [Aestuariibacter halophilus]
MKKLPLPTTDDSQKTTENSNNDLLGETSYPYLKNELQNILNGYLNYHTNSGNAFNVAPVNISDVLADGLKKNYKSPPKDLKFIEDLRKSSPIVCPMCGSLGTGTLDHLFPKEDYPEFAVYSKNLVPACDCNVKRRTNFKDGNKRVLHPYYDNVLNQRLISCEISQDPTFPMAKIKIKFVVPNHPEIESIKFHAEKVILPSGLIGWLEGQWDSLVKDPSLSIHTLPDEHLASLADFERCLDSALSKYDRKFETPNNWYSIFFHGLVNSHGVAQFLYAKHNLIYP